MRKLQVIALKGNYNRGIVSGGQVFPSINASKISNPKTPENSCANIL